MKIKVGQKFLSNGLEVLVKYTDGRMGDWPVCVEYPDGSNAYFSRDGQHEVSSIFDLQPLPVVITEGVEFSGDEYRDEFERLLKIEGRKFQVRGADNVLVPLGFTEYVPHCRYVLLPVPQHADASGNVSDETTRPTTYGEKRVRGNLPPTMQFEDPGWWRELGAEIDGYQADIERLRAKVDELQQQSQPVNERLLNAAKDALIEVDNEVITLSDVFCELNEAIAAAESEIAEREKPVTEEWLLQQPDWMQRPGSSMAPMYAHDELQSVCQFWPSSGAFLSFGKLEIYHATRGDVLDLMRLRGGAT